MSKYFLISIVLLFVSCSAFKSQKVNRKIIEGSYTIVERESNPNNPSSIITGTVYDKESNSPIKGAVVQIEGLKKGGFTDDKGQYTLEIKEVGQQEIQVINVGHTKISTDPIKLEGQVKIKINFYLGTTKEY